MALILLVFACCGACNMIIILSGLPGSGKSYLATQLIYDAWKANPDKKIFTNYPVRLGNRSTMIWEPDYVYENVQDSLVVIDEAYRDYNSRKSLKGGEGSMDDQAHLTFATNRHNTNTFIFISQNIARLDVAIREIGEIWWITKLAVPNFRHITEYDHWHPIYFKAEMFDCLDSFKMRAVMGKKAAYKRKRWLFKKRVAKMYDTHYYGDNKENEFVSKLWFDIEPEEVKHGNLLRIVYNSASNWIWNSCRYLSWSSIRFYRTSSFNLFKGKTLDLWEPRGIRREIIYRNWMLWKPIFSFCHTLKRRVGFTR